MRTLPIPTGRLLIVPGEMIPEDAIFSIHYHQKDLAAISYTFVKEDELFYGGFYLAFGSWSLLGKESELTEEQMELVCENVDYSEGLYGIEAANAQGYPLYDDGKDDDGTWSYLTDVIFHSYASFLTFHGIKENDILLIENKK